MIFDDVAAAVNVVVDEGHRGRTLLLGGGNPLESDAHLCIVGLFGRQARQARKLHAANRIGSRKCLQKPMHF